ncbi:hypothetical protein [Mycobacterium botniense]|uniref:hypothetical protein n=1 Tax=Mycobacterium botniense TaxID=84962 RepID=UPI003FCDEA78
MPSPEIRGFHPTSSQYSSARSTVPPQGEVTSVTFPARKPSSRPRAGREKPG